MSKIASNFKGFLKNINKKKLSAYLFLILYMTLSLVIIIAEQPANIKPNPVWEASVTSPDILRQSFFITSDGFSLEADLLIPVGGNASKAAVVFLGGSGNGIYQNYAPEFVEKYIQGVLLPRDMAVLYINKRGMGKSEGNWMNNDFQGRADDAYAAVQYLKTHPSIDPNKIGLIGHSQGGWIANLAAYQHEDIAFFISLNGPTRTVLEQIIDTYRWDFECQGYEGEELEKKLQRVNKSKIMWGKIGKYFHVGGTGHLSEIIDYDPREVIANIDTPGLFVFSEYDGLVPPNANLERFDEIFDGILPSNLNTTVISSANHSFRLIDGFCDFVDFYDTSIPQSEELVTELNNWLSNLGY